MDEQFVSINGKVVTNFDDAKISIWDTSFHRGDGVFEVMKLLPNEKVINGDDDNDDDNSSGNNTGRKIRSLEKHLDRLQTSSNGVGCPLPSREILKQWLYQAAAAAHSSCGCLRLIATKGGLGNKAAAVLSSVVISCSPLPVWPPTFTLLPLLAPWHPAGAKGWETPIKWTSYGPNVVSTRKAKHAGFTDALLLSSDRLPASGSSPPELKDCHVLDGPNFAIGWIADETLHFPCGSRLGLLPSITQSLIADSVANKLQLRVREGLYTLQDVLRAEGVFVMSTTRGVIPVTRIGTTVLSQSDIVRKLANLLDKLE